jgi:hypothetical protein
MPKMTIKIGDASYLITLCDNATVQALTDKLPMTLEMEELNGNEKYYYFPDSLPSDSQRVGSIKAGDVMLFGSDCLVIFYKDFSTPRSGGLKNPLDLPKRWDEGVSRSRSVTEIDYKSEESCLIWTAFLHRFTERAS